jgi:signal peptidase I
MQKIRHKASLWETIRTIVYAVLIALVIRTVAFEPFSIPSESMLPTLLVGDYLFVAKYEYGYSRHSFPFSMPVLAGEKRLFGAPAERGDVVVFKTPRDNSTDYIKRIIGLPGDRVQMRAGRLFINDAMVEREPMEDFLLEESYGSVARVRQYRETLPNGVSYRVLDLEPEGANDDTEVFVVPAGHYFLLGDNRDNSQDSRVPVARGGVGFVPAINLVGRAEILFFSTDGTAAFWQVWRWPFAIRYQRLFNWVQ